MSRQKRTRKSSAAKRAAKPAAAQLPLELPASTPPAKKKVNYDADELVLPPSPLTAREEQVVEKAAKGAENLEIALELDVDERTVEKHMKNV